MGVADNLDPMASLWHWLAYDIRRFRVSAGLTQPQLGRLLGIAKQTVCNIEANERKLTEKQAITLDEHWSTGGHFLRLLTYARFNHDPDWRKSFFDYEARATVIMNYEALFIPGLLQTPEYARACLTAARPPDVDAAVAARLARQRILERPDPPDLWFLLDEGVLDRPVGGPEVMRAQLARLLEVSTWPNVTLRVVPRSAGACVGLDGPFVVLTVREGDIGFVEAVAGGRLIQDGAEVRALRVRFDRVGADALSRGASRQMLAQKMETMT